MCCIFYLLHAEDIETSLSDYQKSLSILERLVEPDSRHLAELYPFQGLLTRLGMVRITRYQFIYSPGPVKYTDSHMCFVWANHFCVLGIPSSYSLCNSFNCAI